MEKRNWDSTRDVSLSSSPEGAVDIDSTWETGFNNFEINTQKCGGGPGGAERRVAPPQSPSRAFLHAAIGKGHRDIKAASTRRHHHLGSVHQPVAPTVCCSALCSRSQGGVLFSRALGHSNRRFTRALKAAQELAEAQRIRLPGARIAEPNALVPTVRPVRQERCILCTGSAFVARYLHTRHRHS